MRKTNLILYLSILLTTVFCSIDSIGQNTTSQDLDSLVQPFSTKEGEITFHTEGRIDSLEKRLRGKSDIRGYRIQIFLGSYQDAKNMRAAFLTNGLGLQAYIQQNAPDYVVRVGDFKTQLELHKYYDEVKKQYPSALIVVDKIEPPRFPKRGK
ncbi:MAG: SPOR domain-containing protein [Flavobacteriales bacterium]